MKKLFKWILYISLSIIAIIAIGIGGLLYFVDPNQFKPKLEEFALEKANIVLAIKGDMKWTFYPWLGFSIRDVSVASPITPSSPFASVGEVKTSLFLKDLLKKRINMSEVLIDDLHINLLKDQKGITNWDISRKTPKTIENQSTTISNDKPSINNSESNPNFEINIQQFTLSNAVLSFKDAQNNQMTEISSLNLRTGALEPNRPIDLTITGQMANYNPKLLMPFSLQTTLIYDIKTNRYQLNPFNLELSPEAEITHRKALNISLTSNIRADLTTQQFLAEQSVLKLNGKVLNYPIKDAIIKMNVAADLSKDIATINGLSIQYDALNIQGNTTLSNVTKPNLVFKGNLSTNRFDPRPLIKTLGITLPKMESSSALSSLQLKSAIEGSTQQITLNTLSLDFDKTNISGKVSAKIGGKVPTINANLSGNAIQIADYLQPSAPPQKGNANKATSQQKVSQKTFSWDTKPFLAVDGLKAINADITFKFQEIALDTLVLKQNLLALKLNNGIATLSQLKTNVLGSDISASGSLDGTAKLPKVTLKTSLKNLNLTKVVPSLNLSEYITNQTILSLINKDKKSVLVEGILTANLDITSQGKSQKQLVSNLNGAFNFKLSNGKIVNVNYDKLMCEAIATLNQKKLTSQFTQKDTPFTSLGGNFTIKNGIVSNQDLIIDLPGIKATGAGTVNLVSLTADYKVNAILEGDQRINPDPACQISDDFKNLPFPLICRGSLVATGNASLCSIDSNELGKLALSIGERKLKKKVDKEIDKQKEKLGNKLEDELNKQIKKNPKIKGLLQQIL